MVSMRKSLDCTMGSPDIDCRNNETMAFSMLLRTFSGKITSQDKDVVWPAEGP